MALENGALSVTIFGVTMMPLLSADSLDSMLMVRTKMNASNHTCMHVPDCMVHNLL